MEKKQHIIYIWSFIIVASLVLILLYTPLGGSLHLSNNTGYQNYSTGVVFGGKINNAPRIKASQPYIKNETEIKSNNNLPKYAQNINQHSSTNYSQQTSSYNITSKNTKETPSAGGNSGALFAVATINSGGSSAQEVGSSTSSQPFSSDVQNTGAVMQKAVQATDDLADPGGGDPGAPIPVGDGLPFLLILAALYFFHSAKKVKLKKLTASKNKLQ